MLKQTRWPILTSVPRSKKKRMFKRSQSYNDAAVAAVAAAGAGDSDMDENDKDFLDELAPADVASASGSGGGSGSFAARGRKLLKRISRSGATGNFFVVLGPSFLWAFETCV